MFPLIVSCFSLTFVCCVVGKMKKQKPSAKVLKTLYMTVWCMATFLVAFKTKITHRITSVMLIVTSRQMMQDTGNTTIKVAYDDLTEPIETKKKIR